MAEFLWVESAGTTLEEQVRYASTSFGDGYEQGAPDGLNPLVQGWTARFVDVENAIADQMIAFFRARVSAVSGLEAFDYTPLWSTTKIRVVCKGWSRTHSATWGECSVDAKFERVYGR